MENQRTEQRGGDQKSLSQLVEDLGQIVDDLRGVLKAEVGEPAQKAADTGGGEIRGALQKVGEKMGDGIRSIREMLKQKSAEREERRKEEKKGALGKVSLFDGTDKAFDDWKLVGAGELDHRADELRLVAGQEPGLAYFTTRRFGDFRLRFQYRPESPDTELSMAVRFRNPDERVPDRDDPKVSYAYDNPAYIAGHTGFEVILGPRKPGREPGILEGVLLGNAPGAQLHAERAEVRVNDWNELELEVQGDRYTVRLNGKQTAQFTNPDPYRGKAASGDPQAGFLGVLIRKGRMALRQLEAEARTPAEEVQQTQEQEQQQSQTEES